MVSFISNECSDNEYEYDYRNVWNWKYSSLVNFYR